MELLKHYKKYVSFLWNSFLMTLSIFQRIKIRCYKIMSFLTEFKQSHRLDQYPSPGF